MSVLHVLILAAGDSTRLKSKTTKILHPVCGRPMIRYVIEAAKRLKPKKTVLVLGNGKKEVLHELSDEKGLSFVEQKQRLGTAHAAKIGLSALGQVSGKVLILNGDVPLIRSLTLKRLSKTAQKHPLTILTAVLPNPFGYGRILRNREGQIVGIREEKNASLSERQINEINTGVYIVEFRFLKQALDQIKRDPLKKEFYLTEIVNQARRQGISIGSLEVSDAHEILGVNTREELSFLNQVKRNQLIRAHFANGVGMQDPDTVYIDHGVKIGADSSLEASVQLLGQTKLGNNVKVEMGSRIKDSRIGDGVEIKAHSYLEACEVKARAILGPFARVRPGSNIAEEAKVGNFVELKKTRLGKGSKASHLSYLGDAVIGKGANIGAGTITCNFDGKNKYVTHIADGAFIGSDTQLVAPVKVGKEAYVAAGTTVTKDIPPGKLAISRVRQTNLKRKK